MLLLWTIHRKALLQRLAIVVSSSSSSSSSKRIGSSILDDSPKQRRCFMAAVVGRAGFKDPIQFVMGKIFRRIPQDQAEYEIAKKGKRGRPLDHDSTFYIDIVEGEPDSIQYVQFSIIGKKCHPGKQTSYYPYKFFLDSENRDVYRFSTQILTPVPVNCDAVIHGRGGTRKTVRMNAKLENYRGSKQEYVEYRHLMRLEPVPLPKSLLFGIELEIAFVNNKSPQEIVKFLALQESAYFAHSFALKQFRRDNLTGSWALELADIKKDRSMGEVAKILKKIRLRDSNIVVDASMSFRVTVNVAHVDLPGLVRICQHFVQFEPAMDAILGPGSTNDEDSTVRQSNRDAIQGCQSNKERLERLARCESITELCDIMNPGRDGIIGEERQWFKLNLQGLLLSSDNNDDANDDAAKKKKMIEFRQHYGTSDSNEVMNWTRFCSHFVNNSVNQSLSNTQCVVVEDDLEISDLIHSLFNEVIQDRHLTAFFMDRLKPASVVVDHDDDVQDKNRAFIDEVHDAFMHPNYLENAESVAYSTIIGEKSGGRCQ